MAHDDRNYFGDSQIRVDDVIYLESGMVVECSNCPTYIASYENPYSTGTAIHTIKIGVNYERQVNLEKIRSTIFLAIKESFRFFRAPFDDDLAQRYIRYQVPEVDLTPFCVPAGLYIVSG